MSQIADPDRKYAWPRFWLPSDGIVDLSDAGFLRDPTESLGRPPSPAQLAALQNWKALALLGEPGIGKSTTLKEEADRIAALSDVNAVSIYVDLRDYSGETLLHRRIFESDKFIAWENGRSHLFLHLDSLDEALLRIDSIANLLASELPEVPTKRMSIRIACRTAVWPAGTLGAALKEIWGDGSGVFELAPLRRRDVVAALDANDIAVEDFMRALFAAQAVPFAIKPLTLKMLLTIFQRQGDLPKSNLDLYKQGCLALSEEQNISRRDSRRLGRLNAKQRIRLAGRVAAATILGNRFGVWTGPEIDCPKEDIPISGLAGHREQGEFASFEATDDDVREVLDTGLFSSRGGSRMGWAHQNYGEFLAALYLFERGVPAGTLLKALFHPAGGLIPQLSVVAAWAASLDSGLREVLIAQEPLVLLRGDLSSWSPEDRASLVRSLLDLVERNRFTGSPYDNAEAYAKLDHPGLADQLRPVITDATLGVQSRRLALIIAEKCGLAELQPQLLQVALDAGDNPDVRPLAISALQYCGDASVPPLLRPLAYGEGGPDPRDDIKGNALALLWPDHMTATELFPLLTPSAEHYFGAYALFEMTLPDTLKTADLVPALEWASQLIAQAGPNGGFRDMTLADAIMFKAWNVFDDPELTRPFLDHVALRLHQFGDLCRGTNRKTQEAFLSGLRDDVGRRRRFMTAVCADALDRIEAYSYLRTGFLVKADLPWLLDISPGGLYPVAGLNPETLCNFVERLFVADDGAEFELLFAAAERWPALRSRYAFWFDGIPLESAEAAQLRAQQDQLRALANAGPPPLVPDLPAQIERRIADAEKGRWQAWWQLTGYLMLTPESRGWGSELNYFITTMPGWGDADEPLRQRIVATAESYLADAETSIDIWLGREPMPIQRNDVAGLRALILIKQVSPEAYARIPVPTWHKWAPVIVGLPRRIVTVDAPAPDITQILTDALRYAPAVFVTAVRTIIRLERERIRAGAAPTNPPFLILRDLEGCWSSPELNNAIYEEFRNADNTPAEYASLLDALLKAEFAPAFDHALGLLSGSGSSLKSQSLAIANVLLRRAPVRAWPALWTTMAADDDFARELLLQAAVHFSFAEPPYLRVGEREIAELYALMARLFPRDENAERPTGFVTSFDSVGYLRDAIPRHLASMGTQASVEALSGLIANHPDFSSLAYELSLAEQVMRIATWKPLSSKEVLALADKPDLQLVMTPADLSRILVDTLEAYGAALHGAQTPVRDLWDLQRGKSTFCPIDENALSDVITRFLQSALGTSGIFANREVEVSRAPGAPVGQRTDILVNAVRRLENGERFDPITAVIETKGCWNVELFAALEEQLFRDYMIRLRAQVGVYLVGWFDIAKWDAEDSRRNRVPNMPLEDVKMRLDAQAAALPEGFIVRPVILECHVPESPGASRRRGGASPGRSRRGARPQTT